MIQSFRARGVHEVVLASDGTRLNPGRAALALAA